MIATLDSRAQDILDFWFGAAGSAEFGADRKIWWKKKRTFDASLTERFGALLDEAQAGGLTQWESTPGGMLALIVLLDQFSRNAHRNTPRAFAGDARAVSLARRLVESGDDRRLPGAYHRAFAYMPFQHDESIDSQRESLRLFKQLQDETGVTSFHDSAVKHAAVIERFGRYPHRNRILGRATSAEEAAWLERYGGF